MTGRPEVSIVWFRDDLRTADHPALRAALDAGPAIALYVLDEQSPGVRPLGGAARWWLHHALADLRERLAELNVPLVIRRGPAASVVPDVASRAAAGAVFWNRRYGAPERRADQAVKALLAAAGRTGKSFQATLLHEPWRIATWQGNPYRVFTPFWKTLSAQDFRPPLAVPEPQDARNLAVPGGLQLGDLELLPSHPDWSGPLAEAWTPGEQAGQEALADFLDERLADYREARERPGVDGSSRLSPYLRWGHVSPFQVWAGLAPLRREAPESSATFASELGWREFAWHQLYHHPRLATVNLRPEFDRHPWWLPGEDEPDGGSGDADMAALLHAWQRGTTGIPLVDAGQRQLWNTGWMHNRVRMVSASFLVKNLGIHWRLGEQWFWDTLVDADAAANPFNWQWAAGSGADAAPFFRIFNPQIQAKTHDPDGRYLAEWIPELNMPEYPEPCVDLADSRKDALDRLKMMSESGAQQAQTAGRS
ncbi:deoxyribodipyrimidine photo-lyase [Arthrobacter woluwensis]|uniref:cryptochrome/photolyase family protein n=1 Tax=Arthrobacter woluwensis TaxID=156980 RepID=UPI00277D23F2|nr:deoxyribodipyrimidine photo-lyase [Arthrobacter woluwensis]MDQ0707420.1 deoxyribodipyrimidine photo-lyase [Arthrobacter woluwensis]